jgi:hypothetical protein
MMVINRSNLNLLEKIQLPDFQNLAVLNRVTYLYIPLLRISLKNTPTDHAN